MRAKFGRRVRPLANAHTRASYTRFLLPIFPRVKVKSNLPHGHIYLSQNPKTRAHLGAENIREKAQDGKE